MTFIESTSGKILGDPPGEVIFSYAVKDFEKRKVFVVPEKGVPSAVI